MDKAEHVKLSEARKLRILNELSREYDDFWKPVAGVLSKRMKWKPIPLDYQNGELNQWGREMFAELDRSVSHEYARVKQAQFICGDLPHDLPYYHLRIYLAKEAVESYMIRGPTNVLREQRQKESQSAG
jgi:hypothetical protein